jgi:hypothetical protein
MSLATAIRQPPAYPPRPRAVAGPDGSSGYRTTKRVALLDAHQPITKQVYDPRSVSPANLKGMVERMLEVSPFDLAALAKNANASVAAGRPPLLQIGHTPIDQDKPEAFLPKPVGYTDHYVVGDLGGVPHLFADLHCREDLADEAATFPNLSVERVNFDDDASHSIHAVALLRRQPERPLPMVRFAADRRKSLVCYSADRPVYPSGEPLPGELVAYATKTSCFDPALARRRLLQDRTGFRANYNRDNVQRVAYAAEVVAKSTPPRGIASAFVEFASRRCISDVNAARKEFEQAKARGEV